MRLENQPILGEMCPEDFSEMLKLEETSKKVDNNLHRYSSSRILNLNGTVASEGP